MESADEPVAVNSGETNDVGAVQQESDFTTPKTIESAPSEPAVESEALETGVSCQPVPEGTDLLSSEQAGTYNEPLVSEPVGSEPITEDTPMETKITHEEGEEVPDAEPVAEKSPEPVAEEEAGGGSMSAKAAEDGKVASPVAGDGDAAPTLVKDHEAAVPEASIEEDEREAVQKNALAADSESEVQAEKGSTTEGNEDKSTSKPAETTVESETKDDGLEAKEGEAAKEMEDRVEREGTPVGSDKAQDEETAVINAEGSSSETENSIGLVLSDPRSVADENTDATGTETNKNSAPDDSDVCIIGEETTKPATTSETKSSSSNKAPHPCLVCKKVIKCKYNIVGNGDIRHLCDDICFKSFRATPTQYLRSDGQVKAPTKPDNDNKDKSQWTPKNQLCTYCTKSFKTDQFSKFEVKGGEIKPFCSADCLKDYKAGKKICAFCKADVKNKKDSLLASVYDGNGMAEFCNKTCHEKFVGKFTPNEKGTEVEIVSETLPPKRGNQSSTTPAQSQKPPPPKSTNNSGQPECSVCGQKTKVKHEITFGGKTHKLCSDACFGAFRYANKLATNECAHCGSHCLSEGTNPHTIQFEGQSKKFCSATCVNAFKVGKTRIVPCTWCSAKKLNIDMIERVDANSTYQLFCSLNCLSLYRVNLQATSNQSVPCDQCRKMAPAQYHLTMSDASVRNFCDYSCVMAFQGQFAKPQNQTNTNPTNGRPTPMAQSKNTAAPQTNSASGRQSRGRRGVMNQGQNSNVPVISNVRSLADNAAPPAGRGRGVANSVANAGVGVAQTATVGSQIIIQPPPPKPVRNKALQCKPFVQTKATTCRPHTTTREVQTDESCLQKKDQVIFPIPVPIYVPMPMAMYNAPQPYPVPIPVPIPVPMFIPTTRKSADSILRHIKEIQERMPADPFEAELLMMAEAVASAGNPDSSDESDAEDRLPTEPALVSTLPNLQSVTGAGGDMGEDMLSMALRMAEMRSGEENALDLEDNITATAVPPQPPPPPTHGTQPEFSTIDQDSDILSATRGSTRGKRRRGRGTSNGAPRTKRTRVDEVPQPEPEPPAPVIPQPIISDANMVLKYSFGVNAWKHWVIQKNDQLEKASSGRSGKLKLFKTDLLQCTSDELNYSLCLFVKEVRKPNGDEYAPDSIYYLCLGIQQYLYENSRIDNIFTDFYYEKFTECLNGILTRYEVRLNTQGLIVCRIEEEHLWECKQLGAHSPHVLLNTLIYFNTRFFMLRTADDHVRLSFSHIMKHWKKTNVTGTRTPGRSVYLRYYAPVNAKDNANKNRKREEIPVYEQGENVDNPLRCPVKLYEFYLSKCPESIRNRNDVFYLVPERSCVPDSPVWYSTASLGVDAMSKMLNRVRVVREIQERHLHHQPYIS